MPPPPGMALVEVWRETGQHDAFLVKPVKTLSDGVELVEGSPAQTYGSDWVIATRDGDHWIGLSYDEAWPLIVQLPEWVHK